MAQHKDYKSTAISIVHYIMHGFVYLLATSKQRDREGEVSERREKGRMKIIIGRKNKWMSIYK